MLPFTREQFLAVFVGKTRVRVHFHDSPEASLRGRPIMAGPARR